jgi:hypothetical protein
MTLGEGLFAHILKFAFSNSAIAFSRGVYVEEQSKKVVSMYLFLDLVT